MSKKINKKLCLIAITLVMLFSPMVALASDDKDENDSILSIDSIIESQIENLKLDELQEIIRDLNNSYGNEFIFLEFKDMLISLVKGEEVISGKDILTLIFRMIFKEILVNWEIMAKILVLTIICAVLTNIQSAFESDTTGELAFYVCYLVLISFAIKSFALAMEIGRGVIDQMVVFMQALLPTLITLLLAMGGLTSSALFQPVILGAVSVISTLMKDVILPMIFISAVIGIISKISNKIQISKLSSLIRQIATGAIGIALTIFIGIMSIQGATTAKVDGVTIRTAKFAVDKFVPIVGKFLSDAMDTVVGCSMLLKNAIGVIGLITLFVICAIPIIKIISLILVYKVTIAIIEPISDTRISDCLSEISKSLVLMLATVAAVGMMFFIAITIIIGAGNVTIMLR